MRYGLSLWAPAAVILATLASCSPTGATNQNTPSVDPATSASAAASIDADEIFERVSFLSSDELGGRDTPSPGLERAAAYLVSQYEGMGAEPAGESGTFYQRYPFTYRRFENGTAIEEEVFPPNVVAMIPGSDPVLRDEYVVLSAHFDHVGIGSPVGIDSIYNGADDNGTGTAALLEVAEAFRSLPQPPRRSIMFLHVSGEEHGLLGSEYFSDHPTVPIDQIVANINVDMIGRNADDMIVVIGQEYSSLGRLVKDVADERPELGLEVATDPWPQERFFFRSDHFNFARKGVPAVFFFAGVHEDYHQPSDTVEKIDPDKAARVARLIFHSAEEIAHADARPRWDREGWEEVRRLTR